MIAYDFVAAPASSPAPTAASEELAPIGARVRALREAMDLSLRDLAERSGVSAPMLSQVERGETSPTLAVAGKIAAGLELTLSQLLRLDESPHAVVTRAGRRRSYS
ncbi:MAG: helix-turn-helix domain-containing protein, partial [Solirubrobacterales bacterium]